ncbi:protein ENHANCED DOWNY MILDEW 2 [Andrographis paniculata]|uniref:protein ENHANCED DOWNY MILDEW 2 n=1 Tax=Andrographis paniculata TaxID=175694 RepID=UPI0021E732C8|nr:protein ENHANCED DOWNY MILDEW 2 [Andrographis paniculata]XP_051128182.1 protein ENHANCED DOWNY MILDEW 2 [Andrographis paniculata]XP_051128183.1 protein ENHANCED DOWNY MILDEW 2 [Andrographis paniculata]XP_051128184.1 protein ENHANCED DOWNY MILDEW 2 [Andrographis paniculata]XP_051128185.1 protein ENHANCED DOWNY MILDEW 2 [Andrographis paniculata]
MASSDDEGEMVPKNVSEYEFLSDNGAAVSFSRLPIDWDGSGVQNEKKRRTFFLSGKTDNGLLKIYKEVVAWKFELSHGRPEISVLSTEGHWIKLLKPRNAFQDIIRTIRITLHFLYFARRNPQQSEKVLWDYLNKTFSMFERRPCEDDLADNMHLINEAVKRDEALANSKLLSAFLNQPRKRKIISEDINPPFIVDDANGDEGFEEYLKLNGSDDDGSDDDDCFDSVCAICDNGGHIYLCEGPCMRSFHATVEDGEESNCESLGFDAEELEAMRSLPYFCKNCEYKKHQCFACGELGSSDKSSGAEVFCCANGACGYFYHPSCVANLLHPDDRAAAAEHLKKIAAGETFACPAHKCHVCKELEVRSNHDLQFAVCRRCPRAYHRKCLPREIAFEEDVDEEGEILQRAWDGLIPNRILIYCPNHEIDPEIATPVRDHIKFPGPKNDQKKSLSLQSRKRQDLIKGRVFTSDDNAGKRIPEKSAVNLSSSSKQGDFSRKIIKKLHELEPSKKVKATTNRNSVGKSKETADHLGKPCLGDRLYAAFFDMDSEPEKSSTEETSRDDQQRTQTVKPNALRVNTSVTLDADSQKRILALMKDASSSITLEQVKEKHKPPSTHSQYSRFYADNITMGKVEGTIQAVRTALKKLDEGGNVEDAKAVCGKDLLGQLMKWKEKFKVYLAPFLYGMRYTSFGRHFTKMGKLKEIVDILHWYIQDNDMVVDFCCGSNDFSCLVKKKVDQTGKKCSFKNYDILQAKNDFCFERRDWMGVRPNELPNGSQLIMGLNPPFGVNAALANKFVNKALEFKPKLIILIVPRETQRLDEKESPYDLIWEDDQMFVGKSFYLPGSVDVNDKQIEDWNVSAPVLYLWSRPDWTPKHKAIAKRYGHFPGAEKKQSHNEIQATNSSQECENLDTPMGEDLHLEKPEMNEQTVQPDTHRQKDKATVIHSEASPHASNGATRDKRFANRAEEGSKSGGKRKRRRRSNDNFPEDNFRARRSMTQHLSPKVPRLGSVETRSPKVGDKPSQVHSWRDGRLPSVDQRNFSTYQQRRPQNVYDGNKGMDSMPRPRMYSLNGDEPFPTLASRHPYAPSPMPDYDLRASFEHSYAPSPRPEYGLRASAERWMAPEERATNLPPHHRLPSHISEEIAKYGRDPNSWNQQGIRPLPPPPSYPGQGFLPPQGQVRPAFDTTYGGMNSNTSAMQRYASRLGLEEVNHPPMGARPPVLDPTGMLHPHPPPMQHGGFPSAPGPRPYPHQGSSGWLNG